MSFLKKACCAATAGVVAVSAALIPSAVNKTTANAAENAEGTYDWGTMEIGGGGFVSGIVTGQKEMYLRTDVGGAYKYNYTKGEWEQLFGFLNEADRGLLSVSGIAIDPTDDNTAYFLCGCAYFSDAKTVIFKTTDGGKTFTRIDVTDLIQVHGNGDGRECSEPIAVDPDNPDIIYAGGDVAAGDSALIKSTDGGKTWAAVKGYSDAVEYPYTVKWPFWTNHEVKAITTGAEQGYNQQNGVATIHIEDGKVYVGTSVTGETNVHVADVETDKFTELSADLPTANYPVTISSDNNGNLFVTYIAGLAFSGNEGGAYKYNIKSGTVTDISPITGTNKNAIGMITADKNDPNKLFARTCGVWSDQWYEKEWTDGSIAWGDHFFRSKDGGTTWEDITPGQQKGQYTDKHYFVSEPIDTNGYDWIYGKACHWGSGILIDPRNPDKIIMTSGNGVFACDNAWAEKGIQFYFDPKGVEEVVALDMVSVKGGNAYSAIGDYDGYIHSNVDEIGIQYKPNMGSTGVIAACRQNPDIMVRFAENEGKGYYSKDAGKTWNEMKDAGGSGGHGDIAKIDDDTYRIFHTNASGIQYSDDFGDTWSKSTGTVGTKVFGVYVEDSDPSIVYSYTAKYNDYWASDTTKKEPTLDDAQYDLMVSTDGGKTFTNQIVCAYDQCDVANRIAYLGKGQIVLGAGWNGAYISNDYGKTVKKLDNVFYCKTIGYGKAAPDSDVNTLYMYGKPTESDTEGIYRSTDAGESWTLINSDHLYGGTGNGNFLVGDMNEYGMVYMSTVGCGIVYGRIGSGEKPTEPSTEETTEKPTVKPTETTEEVKPTDESKPTESTDAPTETTKEDVTESSEESSEVTSVNDPSSEDKAKYGDVNVDDNVTIADAVLLNKYLVNSATLSAQGMKNADAYKNDKIESSDTLAILKLIVGTYDELPVYPE